MTVCAKRTDRQPQITVRKQEWRSVRSIRTVNRKSRSVSKSDGPCETYGPSTANNGPYQCSSIGHECFACTHAELFSGEERKKRQISLNTSPWRFSFDGTDLLLVYIFPNSCHYIFFSVNLSLRSCFGQTVFELHRHSFRFIDPSLQH